MLSPRGKSKRRVLLVLALLALAIAAGAAGGAWRGELGREALHLKRLAFDRVPCPPQTARTLVALAFGQSNAGNHAEVRHRGAPNVVNFFEGRCFAAQEPLLGADGGGGGVWALTGSLLSGEFDHVVIAPAALGSSRVAQWNADLAPRLEARLAALRAAGYRVTHFLWHQGEADAGITAPQDYAQALRRLIARARRDFPQAGFWVAQASRCGSLEDAGLRQAQAAVVDAGARIFAGPDTDLIPREQRFDGCHFGRKGQERAARMWADAILQSQRR